MNDLKFSCPSCSQHIQLDDSYAGEKIPCPSCGSVVRVPTDAPHVTQSPPPTAPAAAATFSGSLSAVPTLEENFLGETGAPMPTSPPLTEREQQLAAARAAHPVSSTPMLKPRLSFILSGGQAPIAQENESALHADHKPHENPPHSGTLSE